MKLLLNTFLLLLCSTSLFAQGENNVWAFGVNYGLDFNVGGPIKIKTSMLTVEGCASVCDKNGNLLFYSNGSKVWNKNHLVMPNGFGLIGNGPSFDTNTLGSATQGVAIASHPQKSNIYYLFVLNSQEDMSTDSVGRLRCTMIDTKLNGGLGDVVNGYKNIIIDSFVGEKMTAVKGAGCYSWIIVHSMKGPFFHAFKIGDTGLNIIPVISISGFGEEGLTYSAAEMKISPQGDKLANVRYNKDLEPYIFGVEIHRFDAATGKVSDAVYLTQKANYGIEFSPNGQFLYFNEDNSGLFQYNLKDWPNKDSILSSKIQISPHTTYGFRLGPNKKIYTLSGWTDDGNIFCSVINSPNEFGLASNYEYNFIHLPIENPIYNGFGGLGNSVAVVKTVDTVFSFSDTISCLSNSLELKTSKGENYLWSTGETTPSIKVSKSSTVWVATTVDACRVTIDTFKVGLPKIFSKLRDTVICNENILSLDAQTDDAIYKWQDGSTAATYTTNQAGKYWVNVITPECNVTDTITVNDGNFTFDLGENRSVCAEEEFKLQPNIVGNYLWQDGSDAKIYAVNETGLYYLKVTRAECFSTDSIFISKVKCNNCLLLPNVFTPNNDSKNDVFRPMISCPVLNYTFKIVNRYGQLVFESNNPSAAWDGKFKNQDAEVGIYYYFIEAVFDKPNSTKELFKGDVSLIR